MKEKPADRHDGILDAALHCFNEHGVKAASIGDICARSGASVGSVYHHFGSKEGIVCALLTEGLRSNVRYLEQSLTGRRGAQSGVHAVVISLINWITAHPDWARFIYANLASARGSHDPELRAINAQHARVIASYFAPHLKAGTLRKLPRECWPSIVLGPTHDYARRWLNGQVTTAISVHAKLFADAAWNAVRRPE